MYEEIYSGIKRQQKAMELVRQLLLEEFDLLVLRDTEAIVHLEFSIHELLRQIATEKSCTINLLAGQSLRNYAGSLAHDDARLLLELYEQLDGLEQLCARQAARNTELSLALLDQSRLLLHGLHSRIVPKTADIYGKKGAMRAVRRPEAALLTGRL